MPRHCSASGCCTRDTRDTRGRGISFHRLPRRDDPRRVQWLENSRRRDPAGGGRWDPSSKYIYFCSQHFESHCFEVVGYSCFPPDSKAPPAAAQGGVPVPPPETLLVATGDAKAAAAPALPEGAPPAPAGPPGPPSPSLFMARLPPRAGSYIQSEHSYQVGSALLWKRRAETALDALGKAQRQLQAGKRREQRLRQRLAELQKDTRGVLEIQVDTRGIPELQRDMQDIPEIRRDTRGTPELQRDTRNIPEFQMDTQGVPELQRDTGDVLELQRDTWGVVEPQRSPRDPLAEREVKPLGGGGR
ncbi:THAP domain-containing protein 7 [Empidonax traillii]|uniref:THAP domain-containing protein 7 n=1 Tax=Empidonax traillii TaxID=164674 RepID=UPI000FFD41F2|nr:THAP domain-containing protein 7 [Empidonax traillii]